MATTYLRIACFAATNCQYDNVLEAYGRMGDEILKKIAHELAESLRKNVSVDWSVRDNVRAKLRLMVKRILRKYKYPPSRQEEAVQLVLDQAAVITGWGQCGSGSDGLL